MRKIVVLLLIASPFAGAETVVLKSGRKLSGVLVEQTPRSVTLEMGPGRVSILMSQVERVIGGGSPLAEYQARAARIGAGDAAGWAELGLWARDAELATQAREAFENAIAIDPSNAEAQRALGHVLTATGWASEAEANRARGLVLYDGEWMSPADRRELIRQRAEDDRADAARRAADVRVREAEERAAAAEAEAARAREAAADTSGMPYDWVFGGCGLNCGYGGGYVGHPGRPHVRPPNPPAQPPPPSNPPPVQTPDPPPTVRTHGATRSTVRH